MSFKWETECVSTIAVHMNMKGCICSDSKPFAGRCSSAELGLLLLSKDCEGKIKKKSVKRWLKQLKKDQWINPFRSLSCASVANSCDCQGSSSSYSWNTQESRCNQLCPGGCLTLFKASRGSGRGLIAVTRELQNFMPNCCGIKLLYTSLIKRLIGQ